VVRFDRDLIWHIGRSVRYAAIDVHINRSIDPKDDRHQGKTIAVVIDASASMAGAKLNAAKQAAIRFVELLGPSDKLAIVSFSDDVIVHAQGISCDEQGKTDAINALTSLEVRSMTNLSAGWLQGSECVARLINQTGSDAGWVMVLTDGLANTGITDPVELTKHASALLARGIGSSVVAIGDEYSTDQVKAIAFGGGGRYHHGNHPDEIVELLQGELELSGKMIARDMVLELQTEPGVKVEMLADFPLMPAEYRPTFGDRQTTSFLLGSVISGSPKGSLLKLTMPSGNVGSASPVLTRLVWDRSGIDGPAASPFTQSEFIFKRGRDNSPQPRRIDVSQSAAEIWISWLVRKLMEWNRRGDFVKIRAFFFEQQRYFRRYCEGLPDELTLIRKFDHIKDQMINPMPERSRREMGILSSKFSRQEHDLRRQEDPIEQGWI
jgi:Ca-activated chloride channel family protein